MGSLYKQKGYSKFVSGGGSLTKKYKDVTDIAVRNLVKGLVSSPPLFNLNPTVFKNDLEIVEYVKSYKPSVKMGVERVSMYRQRGVKLGKIMETNSSADFVKFVRQKFPDFDHVSFYHQGIKR